MEMQREAQELIDLLEGQQQKCSDGNGYLVSQALAFSGGIDSSILAAVFDNAALYTVGTEGAEDVKRAGQVASEMGRELRIITIDEDDMLAAIPELYQAIETDRALVISFELPLFLVCRGASEPTVISGQGADELFGGYARYLKIGPDPSSRQGSNLDDAIKEMEADVGRLVSEGEPRERSIAESHGKEILLPYMRDEIIEMALELPIKYKIDYKNKKRKVLLREVARQLGVPSAAIDCEKKAAQYGSGVTKLLRRMAKAEGMKNDDFVRKLCKG
jgi:asparagine synthase (glutamine-hydrolysing)